MKNLKTRISFIVMLIVLVAFTQSVGAQKENDYVITVNEAFKHANANMIDFTASNAPGFENWKGASINPKPLELYDINGQKLFYQFSVYKAKKLIGTIDVFADKTLGHSINDITFDPKPFKAAKAIKKSKEIAKKRYPTEEIKSTIMVVYSYPSIGAMTVVKDKTNGVEHRIFVDAYTLAEVQDKPATQTEPGVWSMYDQILINGKDNNLKEWQESEQLAQSIEQKAVKEGVNINAAVTEEDIKKLSVSAAAAASTSKKLGVPIRGQEDPYYCGEACIQMISLYYGYPTPTQTSIYKYFFGPNDQKSGLNPDEMIKWVSVKWGKTGTLTSSCTSSDAIKEINSYRPFYSLTRDHYRVCQGYLIQSGYYYMYINDPMPVGSNGTPKIEKIGNGTERKRIYVR